MLWRKDVQDNEFVNVPVHSSKYDRTELRSRGLSDWVWTVIRLSVTPHVRFQGWPLASPEAAVVRVQKYMLIDLLARKRSIKEFQYRFKRCLSIAAVMYRRTTRHCL